MARLFYTSKDGVERSVSLTPEIGSVIKVVSIYAVSDDVEREFWRELKAEMGRSNAKELIREGCHVLYELDENSINHPYQLFCIIQLNDLAAQDKTDSLLWKRDAALLHRSNREWIIVADGNTHLLIDQKPVSVVRVLQHGMNIRLGSLDMKFIDIENISVDSDLLQKLGMDRKCPFCQGTFAVADSIILCPSCGTAHHVECWDAYGSRCSGPTGCRYGL